MEGWIKLHRKLLEKAIWRNCTPSQCKVLITILLMCNYEEQQWIWKGKKFMVKSGEMVTSLNNIARNCGEGITPKIVRNSLDKFQQYGFLKSIGSERGRLITINNWEFYQSIGESVEQNKNSEYYEENERHRAKLEQGVSHWNMEDEKKWVLMEGQSEGKVRATNKKDKNIRINIYSAIFSYWNQKGIIKHRQLTKKIESAMDKALKEYSQDEILEAIDRYSTVYFDKDFYYKHSWTLEKFLRQGNGISNYSDEGIIWINYKRHKEKVETKKNCEGCNIHEQREKYILC